MNDLVPMCSFVPLFKELFSYRKYLKLKFITMKLIKNFDVKIAERKEEIKFDHIYLLDLLLLERKKTLDKNSKLHDALKDSNIARLVLEMIVGAIESFKSTFCWLILLMKYKTTYEKRLREEVRNNIGQRPPKLEDKINCHFVMAFLFETMRYRNATPVAVPHKALENFKNGKFIKKFSLH